MPPAMSTDTEEPESAESELCATQVERTFAASKELSKRAEATARRMADIERRAARVHERLAEDNPDHPEYADKAKHALQSAEGAERFADAANRVTAAQSPKEARASFTPYRPLEGGTADTAVE